MTKKRKKAFTLAELLVVMAVIGLLAGLLLPSLAAARERGRCLVCQSNLRNIGIALRLYLDASDGAMPSADPYPGSYGENSQHWFMNPELMGLLGINLLRDADGKIEGPGKEKSVLMCPTHRQPCMTREILPDYPAQPRPYALSYMANGTLGVSGKGLGSTEYRRESEYKTPGRAMMFCDGNGTAQTPGTVLYDGCPKANFEYRHTKKVNALFLDQHIESLEEKDIPFCSKFDQARFGMFWYAKKP